MNVYCVIGITSGKITQSVFKNFTINLHCQSLLKKLTRAGFELASLGYRSAALPVELSSPQGLEAIIRQLTDSPFSNQHCNLHGPHLWIIYTYIYIYIPCFSILQRFLSDEGSSLETLENYSSHFRITQNFPIISPRFQQCLCSTILFHGKIPKSGMDPKGLEVENRSIIFHLQEILLK